MAPPPCVSPALSPSALLADDLALALEDCLLAVMGGITGNLSTTELSLWVMGGSTPDGMNVTPCVTILYHDVTLSLLSLSSGPIVGQCVDHSLLISVNADNVGGVADATTVSCHLRNIVLS